jgi:hypothetical protein
MMLFIGTKGVRTPLLSRNFCEIFGTIPEKPLNGYVALSLPQLLMTKESLRLSTIVVIIEELLREGTK